MAENVTAEDLARDLTADLALLAACKPDCGWCENPGLHVMEWADGHGVFSDDNDLLAAWPVTLGQVPSATIRPALARWA
jgi:hypothetical protein